MDQENKKPQSHPQDSDRIFFPAYNEFNHEELEGNDLNVDIENFNFSEQNRERLQDLRNIDQLQDQNLNSETFNENQEIQNFEQFQDPLNSQFQQDQNEHQIMYALTPEEQNSASELLFHSSVVNISLILVIVFMVITILIDLTN